MELLGQIRAGQHVVVLDWCSIATTMQEACDEVSALKVGNIKHTTLQAEGYYKAEKSGYTVNGCNVWIVTLNRQGDYIYMYEPANNYAVYITAIDGDESACDEEEAVLFNVQLRQHFPHTGQIEVLADIDTMTLAMARQHARDIAWLTIDIEEVI